MKKVLILGSTGSIGINALKVIERLNDKFKVVGLTAYNNCGLLEEQVGKFNPKYVAVSGKYVAHLKKKLNSSKVKVLNVDNDLGFLASLKEVDIVLIAMSGSAALIPFLSAIKEGKVIAPANKEAIVIAGNIIMAEARKYNAQIIPIDSEQSAIFQALEGRNKDELKTIHLTASGGVLLNRPRNSFDNLSIKEILTHPRWKMGKKITVDSATLMNKGFEVIEAKWLFDVAVDKINVVIHPEAIIHSMAEFVDGSIIAQLAVTDMRLPIQYALTYPKRFATKLESLDFGKLSRMNFLKPDYNKFPSLALAIEAGKKEGSFPSVLNAADEVAVEAFLNGKIKFTDIYKIVEKIVCQHRSKKEVNLKQIIDADKWAREEALKLIKG